MTVLIIIGPISASKDEEWLGVLIELDIELSVSAGAHQKCSVKIRQPVNCRSYSNGTVCDVFHSSICAVVVGGASSSSTCISILSMSFRITCPCTRTTYIQPYHKPAAACSLVITGTVVKCSEHLCWGTHCKGTQTQ